MSQTQTNSTQSSEDVDSQDWQQISARLSRVEDKIELLPCEKDLKNFVTSDKLENKIQTLVSKKDLKVEVGKMENSMITHRDLEKFAKLEDLAKLSEQVAQLSQKVTSLSVDVGKCAKQEDLDNLAIVVNKLSKEVEKCAKQEDLDQLSEKVTKLSEDFTNLSKRCDNFVTKEEFKEGIKVLRDELKEQKADNKDKIDEVKDRIDDVKDRISRTNFGIAMTAVWLTMIFSFGGPQGVFKVVAKAVMSVVSLFT